MIPESFIESWRSHAKWQTLSMVEQDLIISRALVSLYNNPKIKDSLVFCELCGTSHNSPNVAKPVMCC